MVLENKPLAIGQVWRDDVGALYRIVDLADEWVFVKHRDAPKRLWTRRGATEIPRAWFARWTLVHDSI